MKNQFYKSSLWVMVSAAMLLLMSFLLQPSHITVYLAGDSTMADKQVKAFPETGWGMPFHAFFDSTVTVTNVAQNGRSTKTFISDGLWKKITDPLKAGDYVLIQFGHNDEVPTKTAATTETQFKENLVRFVNDSRAKQAIPVLLTPVARRKFDAAGKVQGTHDVYAAIVRNVAAEQHVPLIDLDTESQALIQKFDPEDSKMLFNYLAPRENQNYPEGRADDTHFSELGARKVAEMVLADIKKLKLDLTGRIVVSHLGIK
jgi:lysophospholipase L1-like esterase